ncbi:hypothetical protein AVEN_124128-1 [Araneus ventricosus]|uniref:Uncharacterized protein n=1 Tax=Araneus ventricosus TaxID=182803 RepID=A0A4Y2I5J3_ARAVE|nr:hypothetical protein AVEN_124128-1 [Araneus ventricosus]
MNTNTTPLCVGDPRDVILSPFPVHKNSTAVETPLTFKESTILFSPFPPPEIFYPLITPVESLFAAIVDRVDPALNTEERNRGNETHCASDTALAVWLVTLVTLNGNAFYQKIF